MLNWNAVSFGKVQSVRRRVTLFASTDSTSRHADERPSIDPDNFLAMLFALVPAVITGSKAQSMMASRIAQVRVAGSQQKRTSGGLGKSADIMLFWMSVPSPLVSSQGPPLHVTSVPV